MRRKNDSASHPLASESERKERQDRVLTQNMASITRSISQAVVVKDENLFFLSEPDGNVPLDDEHGFGLYHGDSRVLGGYELTIEGKKWNALGYSSDKGYMATYQLSNPDFHDADGTLVSKEEIGLRWERVLDHTENAMHEKLSFENFSQRPCELSLAFSFKPVFQDVFVVRGLVQERPGRLQPHRWEGDTLQCVYEGADGVVRSLTIAFSFPVNVNENSSARFQLHLKPREVQSLGIRFSVAESHEKTPPSSDGHSTDIEQVKTRLENSAKEWVSQFTEVRSDSLLLNRVLDRSLRDLHVLRSRLADRRYFAAGVPWFVTLFGRDSLLTSYQTLAFNPDYARETLRLLARFQGKEVDDWKDEQPGKIMHEWRDGELAHVGEIPHTPYYGTVDATLLFLMLLGRYSVWTGDVSLFKELRGNVQSALKWASDFGDEDKDGYIEYRSHSKKGLINQGWKDSGNAIVDDDGSLPQPPISLIEVQAYWYAARQAMAELYERTHESEEAVRLRKEASELRERFNRDFWMKEAEFFGMALQKEKRLVRSISSNPGHALWCGIIEEEKAKKTVDRLMSDDMFSGWGMRTLARSEKAYNPVGYHLGTVWPHDNSLMAAGFHRYGFDQEASLLFKGLVEAAMFFEHYRLPELFSGFSRKEYETPVRYPVASHPQAWSAGAVPYLLESCLGLEPDAFVKRLKIVRPCLPPFVDTLDLKRLRVGQAQVDLHFERDKNGRLFPEVVKLDGLLDVIVEPVSSE